METRLSNNEEKLFKLIPKNGKPITSEKLAKVFYDDAVPHNGRTIITIMIKRIKYKSRVISGMPVVESTEGSGPNPIEVWVAPRAEGLAKTAAKKSAKKVKAISK